MNSCRACQMPACRALHDFGSPAICHHFYDGRVPEVRHPLVLGQCSACATVQALSPVAPEALVPRFDWIAYNEPEAHLDALVESLLRLPGIDHRSSIGGISYKEDSTLRRLQDRGFRHTWRVDAQADLAIADPRAGVEMIQDRLRTSLVPKLHAKYGQPNIFIVRHLLEHTHDTRECLQALRQLVKPTGYVVFEVPDCARAFDLCDYTTLWEDHNLYFVESTFRSCLTRGGHAITHYASYPAPYETCLVAITQPAGNQAGDQQESVDVARECARAQHFANGFKARRAAVQQEVRAWRARGKVAAFGAGHQLAMYLNLMELGDQIDFVIDDHPGKKGLRMPGSRVPIVGGEVLQREAIKLCLLSLSAESERRVLAKHQAFVQGGGAFASIFPRRPETVLNFDVAATVTA